MISNREREDLILLALAGLANHPYADKDRLITWLANMLKDLREQG